jgi:hypothetical protein
LFGLISQDHHGLMKGVLLGQGRGQPDVALFRQARKGGSVKSVVRYSVVLTLASVLALAVGASAGEPDAANYVGTKTCKMCHSKDDSGNQFAKWQASKHSKAFEVLGTPEAKAAGAKAGVEDPQKSGKCLKCHSTAYNFTETVATDKVPVEDGVSCESCHGPGKAYKAKAVMEDHAQCVANGMNSPATGNCTKCHNDQSPTWKGSFDAAKAVEEIKHPDPKVKK